MNDASGNGSALRDVQHFWNNHVHDWKVAKSPAGTAEFFREIEDYRYEKLHYLPHLIDFGGYRDQLVLDLGCGVGNDLSRFVKGGARVMGFDLAPHSIALAADNFAQRGLKGSFAVMDGERLGAADDTFDMVFCHTVLHFTPDPAAMVREIHRVLKPGGEAILMTVNRKSWLNFLHRWMNVQIDHLDAPVFRQYTRSEFEALLAPFPERRIVMERFPVKTKVHGGLKGKLFNAGFVGTFNALPRSWVRGTGHHMLAFARKPESTR